MTKPRLQSLEKLNLFLALVGLVSLVAALVADLMTLALVIAVTYLALQIVVAVLERNIPWPAWRIIITLVIIGAILVIPSLSPRTWDVQVDTQGVWSWHPGGSEGLNYYPVTDDPASGHEVNILDSRLDTFTVSCWQEGKLTTNDGSITAEDVDWIKITGGRLDDLWIPYVAVNSDNPGVARKLPRCDSWRVRLWPF